MLLLLALACAFRVPPPAAGEAAPMPLVVHPADSTRPYTRVEERLWFVDTGASRTTCDDDLVASLGLASRWTPLRSRGEVGTVPLRRVVLRDVEVAGWRFARLPCAVRDLETTSSVPDGVAGVLGANLFRHFAVELDFDADRLALFESGEGEGLPLRRERLFGPRLVADLFVDGERVRVVIDTGADRTYLPVSIGAEVRRYTSFRHGTGPGGRKRIEVVERRVEAATIDGEPVALGSYLEREGRLGLLGMDVLGEGRLVVDFPARRLAIGGDEVVEATPAP